MSSPSVTDDDDNLDNRTIILVSTCIGTLLAILIIITLLAICIWKYHSKRSERKTVSSIDTEVKLSMGDQQLSAFENAKMNDFESVSVSLTSAHSLVNQLQPNLVTKLTNEVSVVIF